MNQFDRIEAEGILIDEVRTMPVVGEIFVSPSYVICIGHSGTLEAEYDMKRVTFRGQEVSVVYPNHVLLAKNVSPDYHATIIVVSPAVFNVLSGHAAFAGRFDYELYPSFRLTDSQYADLMAMVAALRAVSHIKLRKRMEVLQSQLVILLILLNTFRTDVNGAMQLKSRKTISRLFYESIVEHGHAHRDVAYYANLFCLTPKYFSAIVRNETGQSASHWIRYYVIAQAKLLMIRNPHASLQQISDEMGFSEQSNFSRFFKRETGITPDKWRQQQL